MAEDKDRKKHPASKRKLQKAKKRGQVAFSRQLCSAASWLSGLVVLTFTLPGIGLSISKMAKTFWGGTQLSISQVPAFCVSIIIKAVGLCAGSALIACLLVGFAQVRIPLKIKVDWKRLNPIKGFRRLLSFKKLSDLGLVLLRMGLVVLVAVLWLRSNWAWFFAPLGLADGLRLAMHKVAVAMVLLGLAGVLGGLQDWWVLRRRFNRDQRMSTEEVRRERKDQDGDPALKAERRKRHRSIIAGTGMGALANAKVVLINPTHIAVALRYEPSGDDAPVVIVSGRDERAIQIRNKAMAIGVPVIEQVQLARALVFLAEGECIAEQQYAAVAEIIRLVEKMV